MVEKKPTKIIQSNLHPVTTASLNATRVVLDPRMHPKALLTHGKLTLLRRVCGYRELSLLGETAPAAFRNSQNNVNVH